MKKKLAVVVLVILVVVLSANYLLQQLLKEIDAGKCKAVLADLRSVAVSVEEYQADHGHYPNVMSFDELVAFLEPQYIRKSPRRGFRYSSNADHYQLVARLYDDPQFSAAECCVFIVSDGRFVVWPECIGRDLSEEFIGAQPN